LAQRLQERGAVIQIPMHALFELRAAVKAEKAGGRATFSRLLTEAAPLHSALVPIDEEFCQALSDPSQA
jgi:hypothetical protein